MASLQVLKSSSLSQFSSIYKFSQKKNSIFSERIIGKFLSFGRCKNGVGIRSRVICGVQEGENQSKGEEPPESLFMKELKRRGMSPASLFEDSKRSINEKEETVKMNEEDVGFMMRNAVTTDYDKSLSGQRERSMMMNSEGLEGLVPRAKVLLTTGGTFFLGFGPLILVTVGLFAALYVYFGSSFVHDGSDMSISLPQYVDPYQYLEDERISQAASRVN